MTPGGNRLRAILYKIRTMDTARELTYVHVADLKTIVECIDGLAWGLECAVNVAHKNREDRYLWIARAQSTADPNDALLAYRDGVLGGLRRAHRIVKEWGAEAQTASTADEQGDADTPPATTPDETPPTGPTSEDRTRP